MLGCRSGKGQAMPPISEAEILCSKNGRADPLPFFVSENLF
jgi:hypothetical protein